MSMMMGPKPHGLAGKGTQFSFPWTVELRFGQNGSGRNSAVEPNRSSTFQTRGSWGRFGLALLAAIHTICAATAQPAEPLTPLSSNFVRRLGNGDDWKDVTGFHRAGDVELPSGQWNKLECICLGDRIWIRLNGKLVNAASDVHPSRGRIGLQSHGAEIVFRKVELQHIAKK